MLEALAETIGNVFTANVTEAVLLQPFASIPVTVYVVVVDGNTVGAPVKAPGCHE